MRGIDWAASARLSAARSEDAFIVRERFADESPRVVIVADRRPAMALCPPGLPCVCGAQPEARLLKRGGWTPDADEVRTNPRATSARLRAVEKLPADPDSAGGAR